MEDSLAVALRIGIVGATGVVGEEMRAVLVERDLPVQELRLLASERSAGKTLDWKGGSLTVEPLSPEAFDGLDVVLFSAGSAISKGFVKAALAAGAYVIDNTQAFRMDPQVPLIIPEVNPEHLQDQRLIANPNCSTIQLVIALKPLHELAGLKRVVLSSYQSASGAGREAMDELRDQVVALLNFRSPKVKAFPRRLAFDVIPFIDAPMPSGESREEWKMVVESRKILGLPELPLSATCVRVPTFVGHCLSVNVEFQAPISLSEAETALTTFPGLSFSEEYSTTADVAGQDEVHVGRLRRDPSVASGLNLWIAADNLRKGAASNSVQILELLLERGLVKLSSAQRLI